jgi:hypothetical protein
MHYFFVNFEFVGGTKKSFNLKSESYSVIATRVMNSEDGWFGIKGELVNLKNVTTVDIQEINLSDLDFTDEDFSYLG